MTVQRNRVISHFIWRGSSVESILEANDGQQSWQHRKISDHLETIQSWSAFQHAAKCSKILCLSFHMHFSRRTWSCGKQYRSNYVLFVKFWYDGVICLHIWRFNSENVLLIVDLLSIRTRNCNDCTSEQMMRKQNYLVDFNAPHCSLTKCCHCQCVFAVYSCKFDLSYFLSED